MNPPVFPNPPCRVLSACPCCDLLVSEPADLPEKASVRCPRCGAVLYRTSPHGIDYVLSLTITAAILFLIANVFPIVGLELQGQRVETTLVGAVVHLWQADKQLLTLLVACTIVIMPIVELTALLWMLLPTRRGQRTTLFPRLFRVMEAVRPWAMVEVFMLALLVSIVKLGHWAEVLPGPGIWALAALMLVMTALTASCDSRLFWQAWEDGA